MIIRYLDPWGFRMWTSYAVLLEVGTIVAI